MYWKVPDEIHQANDEQQVEGIFAKGFLKKQERSRQQRKKCDGDKKIVSEAIPGFEHNASLCKYRLFRNLRMG
jgi:hypothetical protein